MSGARVTAQNNRVARTGAHFTGGNGTMAALVNGLTPPAPSGTCDDFQNSSVFRIWPFSVPVPTMSNPRPRGSRYAAPAGRGLCSGLGDVPSIAIFGPSSPASGGVMIPVPSVVTPQNSVTESYTWPQLNVRENTLQLKNKIASVQSVTVNGVVQTVATASNPAQTPGGPPDYLWYWNPNTTQLAPTYVPPAGATVKVVYTPILAPSAAGPSGPVAVSNVGPSAPPAAPSVLAAQQNSGGQYPYGWVSQALSSSLIPTYDCPSGSAGVPSGAGPSAGVPPPGQTPAAGLSPECAACGSCAQQNSGFLWGVLIALGVFFVLTGNET